MEQIPLVADYQKYFTFFEIENQPVLWADVHELIHNQKIEIKRNLNKVLSLDNLEIILTGAGSSFFIAEITASTIQLITGKNTKAIATTDIVTHPNHYIRKKRPLLLISFARSGDSPESIAAFHLTNKLCDHIFHLIITCNHEGKLAEISASNSYVLKLPPESNDKGLAMTGSVTSMIMAAMLVSNIDNIKSLKSQVDLSIQYARKLLTTQRNLLSEISKLEFKRLVCLGSGPFLGVAREAHLKIQELSNGHIIGKFDSYLGFRHGPMAVVNSDTLIIYFVSNNEYAQKYEMDLIQSIADKNNAKYTLAVSEKMLDVKTDANIFLSDNTEKLNEVFLCACYLIVPQLLGMLKSINLGLNPDNPSVDGTIHRIVQGVKIYDYEPNKNTI